MSFTIEYRLTGTGWSRCTVQCGDAICELSASYLSDALGNLVLAAAGVLAGFHSVATSFDEEPGEYRWCIERTAGGDICVTVRSFDELWGNQPNRDGRVMFEVTCHPLTFGEAVYKAASLVLSSHGEAGYKEKWVEHDFPISQLQLLHKSISRWRGER